MTLDRIADVLDAAARNPAIRDLPGRLQDIDHLRGRIALERNDPTNALALFNAALERDPRPQTALEQAAMLGRSGHPAAGLAHLRYYETLPAAAEVAPTAGMPWLNALVLARQGYWPSELAHLRQVLTSDLHRAPHA
jgi:tetratricopeptide (TPR) repeat protein